MPGTHKALQADADKVVVSCFQGIYFATFKEILIPAPFSRQAVNVPFSSAVRSFFSLSQYVLILYIRSTLKEIIDYYD